MIIEELIETAKTLAVGDTGLSATGESKPTRYRRLGAVGFAPTEANRRAYRKMLITTPGLGECISGAILYDETIRQHTGDGTPFVQMLTDAGISDIKVVSGETDMAGHPGEHATEGHDGLRGGLAEYQQMGARFAEWRARNRCWREHSHPGLHRRQRSALGRYAALCQEAGLVPIIEPEVLMAGSHTLSRCAEVIEAVLRAVFAELVGQHVALEALILKPNMVLAGSACPTQHGIHEVVDVTARCLRRTVPAAVPGVAFLPGGQLAELACARLNELNRRFPSGPQRALAFSFARALQQPAPAAAGPGAVAR